MASRVRVCIVSASGQNVFFAEILSALASAMRRRGIDVGEAVDHFPPPQDDLVYMFVPHEYIPLVKPAAHPTAAQLRRSVAICTEQPGTTWFDIAAGVAGAAGAVVDINVLGAAELARRGVPATHLPLGYIPEWDLWQRDDSAERSLDVVFMGGHTERRATAVARCGSLLRDRTSKLLFVESVLPRRAGDPGYEAGDAKSLTLARARTLLNVHRSELAYMEWHRVLGAVLNGCVVVTELALGTQPLLAGEHFISASIHSLPTVLEAVLDDLDLQDRVRHAAYDLVREELPESGLVDALAAAVDRAAATPITSRSGGAVGPMPEPRPRRRPEYELAAQNDGLDGARMALKHLVVRQRVTERRLEDLRRRLDHVVDVDRIEVLGPRVERPRVSVVVTVYNFADYVGEALRSVALSDMRDLEVVVVDDASSDGSVEVVRDACASHPWLPVTLIRRNRNGGLPAARNLGVRHARAEYVFMLDADNQVYPSGIRQLAEALDQAPDAGFAYGTIEGFDASGPTGLVSFLDWDPARLRFGNYIDAMALLRRGTLESVGGYSDDPSLYGWEDFGVWCAMAAAGIDGVHVRNLVARYRTNPHSMIALTRIDVSAAWSTLLRRFPSLALDPEERPTGAAGASPIAAVPSRAS
jgi:hypothetical protein